MVFIMARKNIAHYCEGCKKASSFKFIAESTVVSEDSAWEHSFWSCEECNSVALFCREADLSDELFENSAYTCLYPPERRRRIFDLPALVKNSYEEAIAC